MMQFVVYEASARIFKNYCFSKQKLYSKAMILTLRKIFSFFDQLNFPELVFSF